MPWVLRLANLLAHVTKRFDEWREIWRNEDGEEDRKFEIYAKSDLVTARKIRQQLALMALAIFDARALDEQFGIKPQRFPDRVSHPHLGVCYSLTLAGSKRPNPLQTQGGREPHSRNASNVHRTMQNQHVRHQKVQVSLPTQRRRMEQTHRGTEAYHRRTEHTWTEFRARKNAQSGI